MSKISRGKKSRIDEISNIIFAILCTIAVILWGYAIFFDEIESPQKPIQEQQNIPPITEKQEPTLQSQVPKEDNFTCPGYYDDVEKYAEDLADFMAQYKDLPFEEQMQKRYDLLVKHGCEWSLFNIHSMGVMDEHIKFLGKDFGPHKPDASDETGVRTIYYPLNGQVVGESDEEIFFNFFIQGVWTDEPFTTEYVASMQPDSSDGSDLRVINKFQAPDPQSQKPAYYFVSALNIEKEDSFMIFSKTASIGDDVYSVSYIKKLSEKDKKEPASTWAEKYLNQYSKIYDFKMPEEKLKKMFEQERETHELIKQQTS